MPNHVRNKLEFNGKQEDIANLLLHVRSKDSSSRYWYGYMTDEVAARARTDEMILDLVLAVVNAAADYDMYATGKATPDNDDYVSSYHYFRDIVEKLGISPQAIIDVIDGCRPDSLGGDLTESVETALCTQVVG